jgi:hypothetical protein
MVSGRRESSIYKYCGSKSENVRQTREEGKGELNVSYICKCLNNENIAQREHIQRVNPKHSKMAILAKGKGGGKTVIIHFLLY